MIDPVELAAALIRCPSVTPAEAGALDLLEEVLKPLGFETWRLTLGYPPDGPIENLYARRGSGGPHFAFAGHTDVVPVGDASAWSADPFGAEAAGGDMVGRGAVDMKGAIAAFVAAAARTSEAGSLSLIITGDEEGNAVFGTAKMLEWMEENGHIPDACLVGEPTSVSRLGDMVKIGRRGAIMARIAVKGRQGHVAYPHRAANPIPALIRILDRLLSRRLDEGSEWFDPSNLEVTDITVGNPAHNIIPAVAAARVSIRFNDAHRGEELDAWLRQIVDEEAPAHEVQVRVAGEPFLTGEGPLSRSVVEAIRDVTGEAPVLSTTGGTSDARFIRRLCPVIEFGLPGASMHQVDEKVALKDLYRLTDIYQRVLERFFAD